MAEGAADDAERDPRDQEEELREMLRQIMSGEGGIDPSKLVGLPGLPGDAAGISRLISQFQGALANAGDGINWKLATDQAVEFAKQTSFTPTDQQRGDLDQAINVAGLWLDESTVISQLVEPAKLMTRVEWIQQTMPFWSQLAEPVATGISDVLTRLLREQAPEELSEMGGMFQDASRLVKGVGGTLFAFQLGQVVGQLSSEVVSGGDVGIPLLEERAALLPQNLGSFGEGLDIPQDQIALYLAVRELAHARLFKHARWLRLQLITSITEFARGISIDTSAVESLVQSFDPSNPEELQAALTRGDLIMPKSEQQLAALARLETMLALVEGWVDVVTAHATARLPRSDAIGESVRRRRATGGPAESAFATLVGLELRPRRLREAARMWQIVTDTMGADKRDELWSHPDLLPTAADIDDPEALVRRLQGEGGDGDDMDQALEELLRDPE
ncbi:zinc-dependent metalloprotease [Naasia lichenicola]|uniref:Zinc-dependent metalloprotease n=1 Tax=Naasia lichenicola TaxID=2565933 RepID=A0A4S4FED5_9MICO|nr:zinc-dependent metalloprotease [Naasia lichenicola]THG28500.1 zinc-dependent metalloprotease [Naasia lichenicola]